MYIQKAWELGEWIPDVRDCKLKRWSLCPCSRSSIAKQLMLLQQEDCSAYSRPIGVIFWQLVCQQLLSASQLPFSESKSQGTHECEPLNVTHLTGSHWCCFGQLTIISKTFQSHISENIVPAYIRVQTCLKSDSFDNRPVYTLHIYHITFVFEHPSWID